MKAVGGFFIERRPKEDAAMLCCSRSLLFLVTAAMSVLLAVPVQAQTRFPGDSPTRGVAIGTPGAGSGKVGTFTIPQRGYGWGYGGLGYGYGIGVSYGYPYGVSYGNYYQGPHYYRPAYGYGRLGYYGACPYCGGRFGYCRCRGPIYYPPLVVDASLSYGPQSVLRFYGINPPTPTAPNVNQAGQFVPPQRNAQQAQRNAQQNGQPPAGLIPAAPQMAAKPVDGARARAWRYIDLGDRSMKGADYRQALSRYKKAMRSDSDLAAPQFRAMFAYLGLGSLDHAADALREGLRIDPGWPNSDFVLDDLFAGKGDADQRPALKAIMTQLDQFPNDAQARLLLGVVLHFDAQPKEAEKQFRRAIKLAGDDSAARLFLPRQPEAEAAAGLLP